MGALVVVGGCIAPTPMAAEADGRSTEPTTSGGVETPVATSSSETGDTSSSSVETTGDGGGPARWCLVGESILLPEAFEEGAIRPDTDGNGRDEWWKSEALWDPIARVGSTRFSVYELEGLAFEPRAELVLGGMLIVAGDVDGDGLVDLALSRWDEPQAWWQRGLDDFTFEATQRPFEAPNYHTRYADLDGDGRLDRLDKENGITVPLRLSLGDGTGAFTEATTIGGGEHALVEVIAGARNNEKLLRFQSPFAGTQETESFFQLVDVSANGDITVKASTESAGLVPTLIVDVNGDGLSDVLGGTSYGLQWLRTQGDRYVHETLTRGRTTVLPGPWSEPGAADALVWHESLQLYQPGDATWEPVDVVDVSAGFQPRALHVPMDADGDQIRDSLQVAETHSLWRLQPCD